MNRDMAHVLGGLGSVLLFVSIAAYGASAQEAAVGRWEGEDGWTLDIRKHPSDFNRYIVTPQGQADRTLTSERLSDLFELDAIDLKRGECKDALCPKGKRLEKVER